MSDLAPSLRYELLQLANRMADGTATSEDAALLSGLLRDRPELRDLYLDFVDTHATLCWEFRNDEHSVNRQSDDHVTSPARRTASNWLPWVIALIATVAAVLGLLHPGEDSVPIQQQAEEGTSRPNSHRQDPQPTMPEVANSKPTGRDSGSAESFGRLARTSAVRWSDAPLMIGDRLQAGGLKLAEGTAEFDFDNGVHMVLTGPAEIELRDAMHAWLHSGQVVFRVPPVAIGFKVETTEAAIVDLGTEFGVRAGGAENSTHRETNDAGRSSHRTELQVYEGEVIAEVKSGRTEASQQKLRVHGGQALQISSDLKGGAQELPFWPERFVYVMPDPSEHPDAAREHSGRKTSRYNKAQHEAIHIVPAPQGIEIDGSLADWDLSGRFTSACEPPWGEFYNLQGAMMFDDQHLYVGGVVADPFPMRSTVSPYVDRELYGGGGCIALRISTDRKLGWPVRARGDGVTTTRAMSPADRNDRLTFVVLWYYAAEQLPCLHLKYGMDFHDRVVNPPGYRGAWKKHADGLGYTVEYAIPWSLLHAADDPPRSGDTLAATWLVHWSDSNGRDWRGHLIDVLNPAEKGWDFQNAATWGRAVYGKSSGPPTLK